MILKKLIIIPIVLSLIFLNCTSVHSESNSSKLYRFETGGLYCCMIDKSGKMIIPPEYDDIFPTYYNNKYYFCAEKHGRYGLLDENVKTILPFKYIQLSSIISDNSIAYGVKNKKTGIIKWGYVDTNGNEFIKPIFDSAMPFYNGIAKVIIGKTWRYIDKNGTVIASKYIQYSFKKNIYTPQNNVNTNITFFQKHKEGLKNKSGKILIQPIYNAIIHFQNGLYGIINNNKYGIADCNGKIIYIPQFKSINEYDGYLRATIDTSKFGYIDSTGKIIIKPTFDFALNFSDNLAAFRDEDNKWGYINTSGKIVVQPQYSVESNFSDGSAFVSKDGISGYYIDNKGIQISTLTFYICNEMRNGFMQSSRNFHEGLAAVFVPDKNSYEFINKSFNFVIKASTEYYDPQLSYVCDFNEGLCAVFTYNEDDHLYYVGYIDKTGKFVIPPKFKYGGWLPNADSFWGNFSQGLAAVEVNGNYGYIDKTGQFIIKPHFQSADIFSEGLAAAQINGKYGYIDRTGQFIIKPQFLSACRFSEGLAAVETDEGFGYIDKTGKTIIKPQFHSADEFSNSIALVTDDTNSYEYIDVQGNIINIHE